MRPNRSAERATSKVALIQQHPHPLPLAESVLCNWVATILEQEDRPGLEVSVLLCDDPTIAALNETYRGHSGPTDVLAFPQSGTEPVPAPAGTKTLGPGTLLGDIVVSVDTARRQAAACSWSVAEEVALLVLHGLLHLLGYEDTDAAQQQAMQAAEEQHFQALFQRGVPRLQETS